MNSTMLVILLFLVASLAGLVLFWAYARRVKQDLDTGPQLVAGTRAEFTLRADRVEQLRALSPEPILLKQSEEGVRVQIDNRPMVPLAVFLGKDVSTALSEAAGAVTERFGPLWVVLVSAGDGERVTVQRLA